MSVHFTNTVAVLVENDKMDISKIQIRCFIPFIRKGVLVRNNVVHLLESFQMKGEHWRGGGDQHLLQGISVDIFLGFYIKKK